MGGQAVGFNDNTLIGPCQYRAQPYAYRLSDRSNTGYEHTIYVVHYVVLDRIGSTTNGWTRSDISDSCVTKPDPIFIGNFD